MLRAQFLRTRADLCTGAILSSACVEAPACAGGPSGAALRFTTSRLYLGRVPDGHERVEVLGPQDVFYSSPGCLPCPNVCDTSLACVDTIYARLTVSDPPGRPGEAMLCVNGVYPMARVGGLNYDVFTTGTPTPGLADLNNISVPVGCPSAASPDVCPLLLDIILTCRGFVPNVGQAYDCVVSIQADPAAPPGCRHPGLYSQTETLAASGGIFVCDTLTGPVLGNGIDNLVAEFLRVKP